MSLYRRETERERDKREKKKKKKIFVLMRVNEIVFSEWNLCFIFTASGQLIVKYGGQRVKNV